MRICIEYGFTNEKSVVFWLAAIVIWGTKKKYYHVILKRKVFVLGWKVELPEVKKGLFKVSFTYHLLVLHVCMLHNIISWLSDHV